MKDFEMTQTQLDTLMEGMKPTPMIALQCGQGRSTQERAHDAWNRLGKEMGFDHYTARPNGKGDRFFTAESTVCKGIAIGDSNFSGCDASAGDCPECGK
tara:strand:+ start:527 stop:823 length:297 start_codon:yes stop_codon:yes gene_type:complete